MPMSCVLGPPAQTTGDLTHVIAVLRHPPNAGKVITRVIQGRSGPGREWFKGMRGRISMATAHTENLSLV